MNKMIAYCGISCEECPTFLATQADDDDRRKELAAQSKERGLDVKPEDINCDGCKAESGRQIEYCSECKIRICATTKGYQTCAECSGFEECADLLKVFEVVPQARARLEELI
jgi:hypothetical protein